MTHVANKGPTRLLLSLLSASSMQAQALGLGPLTLQSGLGHPLQAHIPVYGWAAGEPSATCLKTRVVTLDGALLSRPAAELSGSGANAAIRIKGREGIAEPAVSITVEIGCANAVRREYQVLLDPAPPVPLAATASAASRELPTERAKAVKASAAKPDAATASTQALVQPKPAAVAKARPAPPARNILTLSSTDNADIEQVRAKLVLRQASSLSEPRVENDPARLAALRADQQRVAALLRGEHPADAMASQLRDAQRELRLATLQARNAQRRLDEERQAGQAQLRDTVPMHWAAALAAALLASVAGCAWSLRRRSQDQRRHRDELALLSTPFDAGIADTDPHYRAAEPVRPRVGVATPEPAPVATAAAAPVAPATFDWGQHPHDVPVATSAPAAIAMPDSWQLIERQIDNLRSHEAAPAGIAVQAMVEGAAQEHATQVADMLLAAENWMAEHQPGRAAELLLPYLEREDMLSPAPGLYLLALYRTLDDHAGMQAVKAQLEPCFPAEVAHWNAGTLARRSMADYPQVQSMLDTLGESGALLPYLKGLLLAPEPFDFAVYREIVRAIDIAAARPQEEMTIDFH